jgi:Ca-activated chloride channel homolog
MKRTRQPAASLLRRRGAILPFFVFLLPAILMLCGVAINIAYVRLCKTEMKIATDAAVHAAGRAMSIHQTTEQAIEYAKSVAAMNSVAGKPLVITDNQLVGFGLSTRGNNGYGRYEYSAVSRQDVDNGTRLVNSVSLLGKMNLPLLFRGFPKMNSFDISQASVSTQVDRDIALVIDTSGSMLFYENQTDWNYVFNDLRTRGLISSTDRDRARNAFEGTHNRAPFQNYTNNPNDSYPNSGSNSNYYISNNVWTRLTADQNRNDSYRKVYQYIYDMAYVANTRAPRNSRWAGLEEGVNAFLDVLETTDQEEQVALATFDSTARLNYSLMLSYNTIRTFVDTKYPYGSTAIGRGINAGIPPIMTGSSARPFAAKTIVVLTDGQNNVSPTPQSAAQSMVNQYNITLHTVTFTPEADQATMRDVASIGGGKHYHGNIGDDLVVIFEEIANNLPTILTY